MADSENKVKLTRSSEHTLFIQILILFHSVYCIGIKFFCTCDHVFLLPTVLVPFTEKIPLVEKICHYSSNGKKIQQ